MRIYELDIKEMLFYAGRITLFKASVFQALAHPTRIVIVEVLRYGELSAGTIIEKLGLEQANTSQHLPVLRTKNIVVSCKEGN